MTRTHNVGIAGCAVVLAVLAQVFGSAQQPVPQRAPGTIKEGVTAVLVDVVVRDRRGQPVRDLTIADFEVFEDGVRQNVESFTPFHDDAGSAAPAAGAAGASVPATAASTAAAAAVDTPPVMAIVFDRLGPEARRLAVRAAQEYVGTREETANYVAIFGLDLTLRPLVPFTRNGVAVREALNRIARGGMTGLERPDPQQQSANAADAAAAAANTAAAAAAGGASTSAAIGTSPATALFANMEAELAAGFRDMAIDQQGYAQIDALFAIVKTLGRIPGRKSVILFSEGIAIPPGVQRLFTGVIDAANRANVSIYAMDAAGLRAESDQSRVRDQINAAAGLGINTGYSADAGGGAYTRTLESNEYVLRSDPHYSLGTLAEDTGGLLFDRSNNLSEGFKRIDSDLRNYYLLGYTPTNATYDGRFRTIEVKVKRPGVTIAARKGYFALRNPGGAPINEWEAPAMGALEERPVPNAFPIRAAALLFPERGRPGLVPVVVELKTAPITFKPAADGKSYTSDFTVLVRFLDDRGHVARKVSQHYEIRGELGQMDRASQGDVIFYRESELPPGVYSMDTVVHDALSGKSSVRFSTVEVPKYQEGQLRMSSLVLVKRGENVPENERRGDNPLLVNGVALHPNLGEPVSKAAKELAFYFAVYPAPGRSGPDVRIELVQNGQLAAQLPMPVPPADASGRIQQLGRLPLDRIAPGTYELRAIVKQGGEQVARSTMLRITE